MSITVSQSIICKFRLCERFAGSPCDYSDLGLLGCNTMWFGTYIRVNVLEESISHTTKCCIIDHNLPGIHDGVHEHVMMFGHIQGIFLSSV
jgi:hypothetical protein